MGARDEFYYYFSMKKSILMIAFAIVVTMLASCATRTQSAETGAETVKPIDLPLTRGANPAVAQSASEKSSIPQPGIPHEFGTAVPYARNDTLQYAVLAGGCFWCLEAVYELLPGVIDVISGYTGGTIAAPSYELVSTGMTGHAEAVLILFDPGKVSYDALLSVFWQIHDPTTKDRQGYDIGPQYRSAIFWLNDDQRRAAEASIAQEQQHWPAPIVTEVAAAGPFWPAEQYHQDFYRLYPDYGYCQAIITPKVEKVFGK